MMISDRLKECRTVDEYTLEPSYIGKTLNIEITTMCNEKCIYCEYSARGLHKERKMIDDVFFKRVTKEAYELGITDVGLYMIGEPLMNPKVYEYIKYLKKDVGFQYVYISTNGLACTPSNLKKLVTAGLDSLKFSISGVSRETFLQHHGVDAFNLVRDNIIYASNYRKQVGSDMRLYIFAVLTKHNVHEKETLEALFGKYVDEITCVNVLPGMIGLKGMEEYLLLSEDIGEDCSSNIPCAELFNKIVIDADGFLRSCCYAETDLTKVIDLRNIGLKEAVFGPDMQRIRKRHLENQIEHSICNRCVNRVIEEMYPLSECGGRESVTIEPFDYIAEMKKRFG